MWTLLNDKQTGCEKYSAHTHCFCVQEVKVGVRLSHVCLFFLLLFFFILSPALSLMVHCQQDGVYTHGNVSFHCREWKNTQCFYLIQIKGRHTHAYPLWLYNKPTWNASFTNGKHLYSTATWPLVIAAAFFVPVVLRHLRLTQHDITPSPRLSVTVKGHRQKYWNHRHYKLWGERLAHGCWWEHQERGFKKKKWKSAYYWLYRGFFLWTLSSILAALALHWMHKKPWSRRRDESERKTGLEKQVIKT